MTEDRKPSIAAAIDELQRNLEVNLGNFPHHTYRRLGSGEAHERRMRRAIELLQWLRRNEALIKQRLAQ